MPKLALIGGGGFAKEVAEIAEANGYDVREYFANAPSKIISLSYAGYLEELLARRDEFDAVALAIGAVSRRSIAARSKIVEWLIENRLPCPPLISKHAVCSKGVTVGDGAIVCHAAVLSVDARIGEFCILNSACIVGHDAVIAANSTIAPGAFLGGKVQIGKNTLVGPLAKVLQGVSLVEDVVVGVGCVVIRNVGKGGTVWPKIDKVTTVQ